MTGLGIGQAPSPFAESGSGAVLLERGLELLESEDPLAARLAFQELRCRGGDHPATLVGLGRAHLLSGSADVAEQYALAALEIDPEDDGAVGLRVRALLSQRRFEYAVELSSSHVAAGQRGVELMAAHGSALFRVQRNDEAAEIYRQVLKSDPVHAEAHLRLGSGLTSPRVAALSEDLRAGIEAREEGRLNDAIDRFQLVLVRDPGHPVAHRLLGESLFERRAQSSMASTASEFVELRRLMEWPEVDFELASSFMPDYPGLSLSRRKVASRALALFESRLPTLIGKRGRHDLLAESERTTDDGSRQALRGKRTFDGRVWDDVRGIGGLRAATGIEALDEAFRMGFDTLAHELAHQVHLHGLGRRSLQIRIRNLYRDAIEEGRCLDYYAASNHAEYFGQGVEAFASLGKRPSTEATHGHTRFELMRVDPALHVLIAELVDYDPLAPEVPAERREQLLLASIAVALRCGRPADAVTAAELLPEGESKRSRLAEARRAMLLSRSL